MQNWSPPFCRLQTNQITDITNNTPQAKRKGKRWNYWIPESLANAHQKNIECNFKLQDKLLCVLEINVCNLFVRPTKLFQFPQLRIGASQSWYPENTKTIRFNSNFAVKQEAYKLQRKLHFWVKLQFEGSRKNFEVDSTHAQGLFSDATKNGERVRVLDYGYCLLKTYGKYKYIHIHAGLLQQHGKKREPQVVHTT